MNYYLDQEFHEYFKKPIPWLPTIGKFNKPYHTIELISIGIVAEDGREYYAVCNEFDLKAAQKNKWLNENVLNPIEGEFYHQEPAFAKYHYSESLVLKNFLKWKCKSKNQISREVKDFIYKTSGIHNPKTIANFEEVKHLFPINFYGYYADYDWVLFCSLFGIMMDLPKGFPMYCRDLQQMKDDYRYLSSGYEDVDGVRKELPIETHVLYPEKNSEHHALADAKWNKKLHEFLIKL